MLTLSQVALGPVDWGSVPDWLAGIGSIAALAFALLAVRAANKTNVQQGKQLRTLEEDRRREQAAQVATWLFERDDGRLICRVQNSSPLPIYGVHLYIRHLARPKDIIENRHWARIDSLVLPPGDTEIDVTQLRKKLPAGTEPGLPLDGEWTRPAITFRDSKGIWWYRDVKGLLVETERALLEKMFRAFPNEPWAPGYRVPVIDENLWGSSTLDGILEPHS